MLKKGQRQGWVLMGILALCVGLLGCKKGKREGQAMAQGSQDQAKTGKDNQDRKAKANMASQAKFYVDPGASDPESVKKAVVVMQPTKSYKAHGVIRLEQTEEGLRVTADMKDLPPGTHAYHFHLFGDCSGPKAKTAGTHFHFHGSSKKPPKDIRYITGNLGNLVAKQDGTAQATTVIKGATLQGRFSVLGRSIIVHEKPNDPSKPPIGGAGGRVACGVVGIAE